MKFFAKIAIVAMLAMSVSGCLSFLSDNTDKATVSGSTKKSK